MRYSAMQDSGCEVGLPQDQFSGNIEEHMMATIESVELRNDNNFTEVSQMTSNLPLLFANGYPTSLEKITMTQLERFINFMVKCSLAHDSMDEITEISEITEPQWWPKEVKFSNPLTRPKKITEAWMANLKKLVFRCYTYHRSEYLLRYCSCLARYPHKELEYVDRWDSTTSLYHKTTGKLLVTFRNENMNYDKQYESSRKKLLSHNGIASTTHKTKQLHSVVMVQPPIEDIYLCDNCDGEFTGLDKMKEHERVCCLQEAGSSIEGNGSSRPNTPEISTIKPELQQNQFLQFFNLRPSKPEEKSTGSSTSIIHNKSITRRPSSRIRGYISFVRCPIIPFSSPAGILLARKSKVVMTEDTLQERLERLERHVIAPPLCGESRPKWMLTAETERDKWTISYKPNRDKPADNYVHRYKFVNSAHRKPTLNIKSQLLYSLCRPVYVLLTHLTEGQLEELKRHPPKYRCARNVSATKKESSITTETQAHAQVSTKRKASEDEGDLRAEECGVLPVRQCTGALTDLQVGQRNDTAANATKDSSASFQPSKTITVIDLCSSDEEEDQRTSAASDENRDPLNSSDTDHKKSSLRKRTPSKLYTKPCIYPTDSSNDWLSGSVLSEDCESYTNKYRSPVTLSTCTHISPILRSAP